jgi:ATP-dependent DNA helicase RecQ
MELGAVRSFFPDVPVLAVTATAPPKTISLLKEILVMECPKIVKVHPNRKNIFLNKGYRQDTCYGFESYEKILKPIAFGLQSQRENYQMTVIYMKLKYCGFAYRLFEEIIGEDQYVGKNAQPRCRLFAQFHSPQTDHMKAEILEEIKNETSNIRVIFATSALGMGVDAPGITRVIHIGPPSTLESYLQEIGRVLDVVKNQHPICFFVIQIFLLINLTKALLTHL